jgi:DNA-binding IclR family transcriptional regulator
MEHSDALASLKAARRTAMTRHTVTDLAGLCNALQRVRELGYALNDQEAFLGDLSVSAPLLDRHGRPLGAVNIAVPTPRWQLQDVVHKLVPQLLKTAAAINRELRYL